MAGSPWTYILLSGPAAASMASCPPLGSVLPSLIPDAGRRDRDDRHADDEEQDIPRNRHTCEAPAGKTTRKAGEGSIYAICIGSRIRFIGAPGQSTAMDR
jgi:hypothetical protein